MRKVVPIKIVYQFKLFYNFGRTRICHFLFLNSDVLNRFWIILENSKTETAPPVSGLRCPLARARAHMTRVAAYASSHRHRYGRSPSGLEGANSHCRLNSVEPLQTAPVPIPFQIERESSCTHACALVPFSTRAAYCRQGRHW
jgi:hypothetical protein